LGDVCGGANSTCRRSCRQCFSCLSLANHQIRTFKKFSNFTIQTNLQSAFPKNGKYRNPRIIQANTSIKKGDIMIDNIHKAFEHVKNTSIKELKGKDRKILIINDEAHHFINANVHASATENEDMLEWAKFLRNSEYNFAYILNLSGTPYKGNNYFKDVIYRYSIRQAIEDRIVKDINYLIKFESGERSLTRSWNKKYRQSPEATPHDYNNKKRYTQICK